MNQFKNIYFLGIGGIGMSALARYFHHSGKKVFGYDKTETPLTQTLQNEGIPISFQDEISTFPNNFSKEDTLIVFTPAIPKDSILKNHFIEQKYTMYKRSRVLGIITQETTCLAVAGTHGKTTTSTLLAHLCYDSNQKVSAFLGGISENYQTNFLYQGNEYSVVEADEFDRSFLNLHPKIACITSTDADHLDIYGEDKEVKKSFQDFANLIPQEGKLFIQKQLDITGENVFTYSATEIADYFPSHIIKVGYKTYFDFNHPNGKIENLELPIPGNHNLENAIAALAISKEIGISDEDLRKSLANFKGIKRRFSINELKDGKIYIDDYAHHPTEIHAALQTVNQLFKDKKILTIFQPHLFSRTRDFMEGYAESLNHTTELILLDIYPARELPIEGITSEVLFNKIKLENKKLSTLPEVMNLIKSSNFDVIVTLGAGNIDTLIEKIKAEFS